MYNWISSNILDLCVLALVSKKDVYGYIVTQSVKDELNVSESTLYPVLRRLEKNGCLETYDKSFQGRNRRYYKITKDGKKELKEMKTSWEDHNSHVNIILRRDKNDER